ncbi:MAG TPA: GxxExxY protein [Bryobacteraceae bacterium]|jgi:GxxExxY protein|nr:GxxExxY protein [Bryobacteraceae bacterium]
MHTNEHEFDELIEDVVGAAYEVSNVLGCGFLEKVYERALVNELAVRSIRARSQAVFSVSYKGHPVGDYVADLLVDDRLIVELKCADCLSSEHMAQCINYLKASGIRIGLLINFQHPKVQWKRVIYGF